MTSRGVTASHCACGRAAAGSCVDCAKPLCSEHGAPFDGLLVCAEHFRERSRRAVEERWERGAAEREAREREAQRRREGEKAALARYETRRAAFIETVRALPDEAERVVTAVAATTGADGRCTDPAVLHELFPHLWPTVHAVSFANDRVRWDSESIARWFAAVARGSVPYSDDLWFEPQRGLPRQGWVFPSAKVVTFPPDARRAPVVMRCLVADDGTLYQQGNPADSPQMQAAFIGYGGTLSHAALVRMAALVGADLPALRTPISRSG